MRRGSAGPEEGEWLQGEKINYKEYQQEIGRSLPFSIRASSVTKGIVFSSPALFDSPCVWASSLSSASSSSYSSSSSLLLAVLLYRMVEKINRWKREG